MKKINPKLYVGAALLLAIAAFFYFDGAKYLSFDALKAQRESLSAWVEAHFLVAMPLFVVIYIAVTALSLPGALVLTLAGGALFGVLWGTVAVSFASSIGATLAFLGARWLFGESLRLRFADRLQAVEAGVKKDGAFYLLSLRLVPLVPFFVVNLLMGLTSIPARTFYWVSQLGMFPGTLAYVFAGTQLATISSPKGLVSPPLLIAFAILGVLPLAMRWLLNFLSRTRGTP